MGRFGGGILFFIVFSLVYGGTAVAGDFGIVLGGTGDYVSDTGGKGADFAGSLTPWFSAALGGNAGLYLSGKAVIEHKRGQEAGPPLFELERAEVNFRPAQAVYVSLGRQRYRDSGEMIVSGLFDGIYGSFGFDWARFSLGAFYTGFLYKEAEEILMTAEDQDRYLKPLNYGDAETYFASRRVFLPLGLEFSDLASRLSLALTILSQFDVNGARALNTHYLEIRLDAEAADALRFGLTAVGGLADYKGAETRTNFAAALSMDWDVPGALTDIVNAELRWGSGAVNERIGPFLPVSGIVQGTVFTPTQPGLMNARAAYTARPHRTVSLSVEAVVFWRTDLETFTDKELNGLSTDRFLGTEVSGVLAWAFQSALRLNAGGGVFFPRGPFVEGAGIRWKVNGGIILSL
jgi:hypothetical protein